MQSGTPATNSSKLRIVLSGFMLLSSTMSSLVGLSAVSLAQSTQPTCVCFQAEGCPCPGVEIPRSQINKPASREDVLKEGQRVLLLQQADKFRSNTASRENLLQLVGTLKQISESSSCNESLTLMIRSYNAYIFTKKAESQEYSKLTESVSEKCRASQGTVQTKRSPEAIRLLKNASLAFSQDTSDKAKLMNVIGALIPFTTGSSRSAAIELIVRSYNAFIFSNKKESKDYLRMVDQLAAS